MDERITEEELKQLESSVAMGGRRTIRPIPAPTRNRHPATAQSALTPILPGHRSWGSARAAIVLGLSGAGAGGAVAAASLGPLPVSQRPERSSSQAQGPCSAATRKAVDWPTRPMPSNSWPPSWRTR
jgi:hypothetical protein